MRGYDPEEYAWLKARHICTKCKRERAFEGMTMCPECLEKGTVNAARWRAAHPDEARERVRRSYAKTRSEGRCVTCGRPNPDSAICRCPDCARDSRIRQKTRRVRQIKPDGVCRYCDQPVHPGKKLCEQHWIEARERLLAVRPGNEEHPWRRDEKARRMERCH